MDEVKPGQVRRALARAERGAALDLAEATALLAARGDELDRLCAAAARVRDAGLVAAGRPGMSPTPPRCSSRSPGCAGTGATTARSSRRPGSCARRAGAVPLPRRDPRHRPRRAPSWAARRRCSPSATGPRTAGRRPREWLRRARLRLDAGLRAGDGDPGAGGDRAAAAPQPRRACRGRRCNRLKPVVAVDGDDAGDHLDPAVHREGRAALRLPRQGPRRPAAGAGGRRPARRSRSPPGCWSASARTSTERAETIFAIRAVARQYGRRPGGDRPELPGQAATPRCGTPTTSGSTSTVAAIAVTRLRARPEGAGAGAAEPGRPRPSAGRCSAPGSTTGAASRR